ncbi:MAG: AAA family ATPase [Gammaproteobacteria bacterium]
MSSENPSAFDEKRANTGSTDSVPYFSDPALRQRLDLLQHLIEYADLMLLVKGPYGAGKSALLEELVRTAKEGWWLCRLEASPLTTRDQFLIEFARALGLESTEYDSESLESYVFKQLRLIGRSGRTIVLIVDDAHLLAIPVLDLIVRLYEQRNTDGKLLRVILFAESSLEESLQSPSLKHLERNITHTLDVPPFALDQSRGFLEHLLTHWHQENLLPLPEDVVQKAHTSCEGLPGNLVRYAASLSDRSAKTAKEREVDKRQPDKRVQPKHGAVAVLLLLMVIALYFQDEINSLFEPTQKGVVKLDGGDKVDLPIPQTGPGKSDNQEETGAPSTGKLPLVETAPLPTPEPGPETRAQGSEQSQPDTREMRSAGIEGATERETSTASAEPDRVEKSEASEQTLEPKNEQEEGSSQAVKPGTAAAAGPVASEKATGVPLRGKEWLLAQPKERFTLQLFGVREKAALEEFVADHQLAEHVSVLETRYKGGPWYVLLYGSYPDRKAAEADRDRLVKQYRQLKPWPRTFESIQAQLQQ